MTMGDRLLSLRQVADLTDTKLSTVRRWVRDDRIPVDRVGPLRLKRVRVRASVLVGLFPHLKDLVTLRQSA